MGHKLHAILGPRRTVAEFASRWVLARLIELNQDFAMVPLSAALFDDIMELTDIRKPDPYPGFERLSAGIEAALSDVSWVGPVGYIETEYFGGVGEQCAIAWQAGKLLGGPFHSKTEWRNDGLHTEPPGERAVNQVLSGLGVARNNRMDAFDALGLGRYRDTERCK